MDNPHVYKHIFILPLFQNESTCVNHSNENMFDLYGNFKIVSKTHFRMKSCAPGLVVLKEREKAIRKWPISTHTMSAGLLALTLFAYRTAGFIWL